jgi:hypothetical protein
MKALCAWCQREGRPAFLGERPPFDSDDETHGICSRHQAEVYRGLPAPSDPDLRALFVVRDRDTGLYEYLENTVGRLPDVKVIMERRYTQRRQRAEPVDDERRRFDRRIRHGKVVFGYTVYRFKPRGPWPVVDDRGDDAVNGTS